MTTTPIRDGTEELRRAVEFRADRFAPELKWYHRPKSNREGFFRAPRGRDIIEAQSSEQLVQKKCLPCEGGVAPYSPDDAKRQLAQLSGWRLTHDGKRIRKDWTVKNFIAGVEFFVAVAREAEAEQHHPDLHLEEYRKAWIEIWTHAIGGLSENDFILAAKIDRLPVKVKQ